MPRSRIDRAAPAAAASGRTAARPALEASGRLDIDHSGLNCLGSGESRVHVGELLESLRLGLPRPPTPALPQKGREKKTSARPLRARAGADGSFRRAGAPQAARTRAPTGERQEKRNRPAHGRRSKRSPPPAWERPGWGGFGVRRKRQHLQLPSMSQWSYPRSADDLRAVGPRPPMGNFEFKFYDLIFEFSNLKSRIRHRDGVHTVSGRCV